MKYNVSALCASGGLALLLILGCDHGGSNSAVAAKPAPPVDVAAIRTKAEGGDAAAQAQLGKLYEKGEGVTNSYKEAAKWFKASSEQGHADGQAGLAELYDAGQGGVP